MGINFELLKFDINPLKEGFQMPYGTVQETMFRYNPEDILSPELISFFTKNIASVTHVLLFHQRPGKIVQPIHMDGAGAFQLCVNWVFAEKCMMSWFLPRVEKAPLVERNEANAPYVRFTDDEVDLIEQTTDHGPFLASVGSVPHQAINLSDTDRWSISLRLPHALFRTWKIGLDKFSPWIINER
jgi:hypothetical protein